MKLDDGHGQPLAGVVYQCWGMALPGPDGEDGMMAMLRGLVDPERPEMRAVSDAAGRMTIWLPVDGMAAGELSAEGRGSKDLVEVVDQSELRTISLPELAVVTGRVLDAQGRPVPEVTVSARFGDSSSGASTRPDGRFEIRLLREGLCRIEFRSPAAHPVILLPIEDVETALGKTVDLGDIRPSPGVPLRIRVRDQSGRPVPGVRFQVDGPANLDLPPSDDQGRIRAAVAPGLNHLDCGWYALPKPYLPVDGGPLALRAELGQPLPEVQIELQRGVMVRGGLRDEAGQPLPNETFRLGNHGRQHEAVTDADGRFEAGPVDPSQEVEARLGGAMSNPPDRRIVPREPIELPENGEELWLTVAEIPEVTIHGRVVDEAGQGQPGVEVVLHAGYQAWREDNWATGAEERTTRTGLDGAYQFTIREGWLVSLQLDTPDYRTLSVGRYPVSGRHAAPPDAISPFVVEPLKFAVPGRVVDEAGRPATGVTVYALGQRPDEPLVTGSDGRFELDGLSPATKVVIALRGEREYGRGVVDGGELTIRMGVAEPASETQRRAMAVRLLQDAWDRDDGRRDGRLWALTARLDPALAATQAMRLEPGYQKSETVAHLLRQVARTEPAAVVPLLWMLPQVSSIPARWALTGELAVRLRPVDPEQADKLGRQTEAGVADFIARGRIVPDDVWPEPGDEFRAHGSLVCWNLMRGRAAEARELLDHAVADAQERGTDALDGLAEELVPCIEALDEVLPLIAEPWVATRCRTAALLWLARHDPPACRDWIARWYDHGTTALEQSTAVAAAVALAVTDPETALRLALRIDRPQARIFALVAVLPHLDGPAANEGAEMLRKAATQTPEVTAAVAARTLWKRWPEQAEELLDQARETALTMNSELAVMTVAYELAELHPNQARELIETFITAQRNGPHQDWTVQLAMQALCPLSIEDAIALNELCAGPWGNLLGVVEWLMLDETLRATRPLGYWSAAWDGNVH